MDIKKYCLNSESLIIDAIELIEFNNSRCVIILNESNKVLGVLSEGDIIRLLLKKINLNSPVKKVINKSFKFLGIENKIEDTEILDLFLKGITLIPIINNERKLLDIIISSDYLKSKIIE